MLEQAPSRKMLEICIRKYQTNILKSIAESIISKQAYPLCSAQCMIIRTNRAHLDPVVCHGIEAVVAYKQDLIRAENLRADAAKRPSWQERNLKRECITPEPLAINFKNGGKFNEKF